MNDRSIDRVVYDLSEKYNNYLVYQSSCVLGYFDVARSPGMSHSTATPFRILAGLVKSTRMLVQCGFIFYGEDDYQRRCLLDLAAARDA